MWDAGSLCILEAEKGQVLAEVDWMLVSLALLSGEAGALVASVTGPPGSKEVVRLIWDVEGCVLRQASWDLLQWTEIDADTVVLDRYESRPLSKQLGIRYISPVLIALVHCA